MGFRVSGLRVWDLGLGCRVQVFRVWDSGYGVQGLGFRGVRFRAEWIPSNYCVV